MKRIILLGLFILGFLSINVYSSEKNVGVSMDCHADFWQRMYGEQFPAKMIVKDLADLGVTEIYFFDQEGRGGGFLHPTEVEHAYSRGYLGDRDFLKELLEESEKYGIDVWLFWTTSMRGAKWPKAEFYGLNNPALKKIYLDLIDELNKKYSQYKNLKGIHWHELDCSEMVESHEEDLDDFKDFCKKRFNEEYQDTSMPKTNPKDKWWRRFLLYRNSVVNLFTREMAEHARKYNLKTAFCFYAPETWNHESWKWGYDAIELEKICDKMWFAGPVTGSVNWAGPEAGKFYQSFKGSVIEFGPSYKGQTLSRNYSYAFHGSSFSFFEYRAPIYIEKVRAYFREGPFYDKNWAKKHGDIYNDYLGYTEKQLSLFYGKKNLGNWLNLMSSWQPGESPAKVSVAINPTPFIMLYPVNPGKKYKVKVDEPMELLTRYFDINGMVTGSLKMKENLKSYKLIIIPEDMATGLDKESYSLYLSYVKRGGKLLIINTPVSTGREDLTNLSDKTKELCGVSIKGKNLAGFLSMKSDVSSLYLPEKKFWANSTKIKLKGAEMLVEDKYTDMPLLTRYRLGKGEVIFSAIGFNPKVADYFASIVKSTLSLPVSLKNSKGMRIMETTKKDNNLCISLWGKGTSILKVDTKSLNLKGNVFQVKDIVTGKIIKNSISSESLLSGVPIEIKYLNQPYILAIGNKEDLKEYQGIYSSEKVFEGMGEVAEFEGSLMPITVPLGKGPRIGVYHRGYGTESIIKVLKKEKLRVFSLPRIDTSALSCCDVLILPQLPSSTFLNRKIEELRKYVKKGGGILLLHDAVGFRKHEVLFPEIGEGITNPKLDILKVVEENEVTSGLKKGETFIPGFRYDHISIKKGLSGEVLIENEKGAAVVVAGKVGKGRVVLNGMLTGISGEKNDGSASKETEPEGGELRILINAVKWLGSK